MTTPKEKRDNRTQSAGNICSICLKQIIVQGHVANAIINLCTSYRELLVRVRWIWSDKWNTSGYVKHSNVMRSFIILKDDGQWYCKTERKNANSWPECLGIITSIKSQKDKYQRYIWFYWIPVKDKLLRYQKKKICARWKNMRDKRKLKNLMESVLQSK